MFLFFVIISIIGSIDDSDQSDDEPPRQTPTAVPNWRYFMDDRDVRLLSEGLVRLARRYDVRLAEFEVRKSIAQNMTAELSEESRWEQIWLWLLTVIGDYDEQDVANELEDSIYDSGGDVREFLERFKLCCAAN